MFIGIIKIYLTLLILNSFVGGKDNLFEDVYNKDLNIENKYSLHKNLYWR